MGRQIIVASASKPCPIIKKAFINHAEKQHAALQHKSSQEKDHAVHLTEKQAMAIFLGPLSMWCVEQTELKVKYDWVMQVQAERKSGTSNGSLFGKHYLGLPGWDKHDYPRKPSSAWFVKEPKSAVVAAQAQDAKLAIATIPSRIMEPVQPAADSSAVQILSNSMEADVRMADDKQAKVISPAATPISIPTQQQLQDTTTLKDNSCTTVLASPTSFTQEASRPKGFLATIKSWFNSFMAFEVEVTIGF
jgi:hypothetical protein